LRLDEQEFGRVARFSTLRRCKNRFIEGNWPGAKSKKVLVFAPQLDTLCDEDIRIS
jgi:hypothetical protein